MRSSATMSIGDLAARFGLAPHVLRHWEDMGLLAPARDGGGRRVYGPAEATRVVLIQLGKEAGLSLEQTRTLLARTADRAARRALYEEHSERLRQRIAAAQASLAIVEHAARCEAEDIATCPHLRAEIASRLPSKLPRGQILGGAHLPGVGDQFGEPLDRDLG
ncbi:MerR family transcriptional regulator [Actinoplanes sp. NPDC051861]|uniref:MerR family transcriptional regulator n=1 Tax=Actinoplanes sp. NPDC051861 TaxID=3155170 RepID=UPI00342E55C6